MKSNLCFWVIFFYRAPSLLVPSVSRMPLCVFYLCSMYLMISSMRRAFFTLVFALYPNLLSSARFVSTTEVQLSHGSTDSESSHIFIYFSSKETAIAVRKVGRKAEEKGKY